MTDIGTAEADIWIRAEANAMWEKLRVFPAKDRLFVLATINNLVTRKLRSRESTTQYAASPIDFTQDEPPTNPSKPNLGETETRAIDIDALETLRKKSTRE